jgi:hypothetical protein
MLITAGDGRGLPMDYDELQRWTRESRGAGEPMLAKLLLCAM